jgi:Ca-activated chloride channel family protein
MMSPSTESFARRFPRPATLALMLLATGQGSLPAQPSAVFRADTRLVVLHAVVRDKRGDLVTNLDRAAFSVYEDGKPQRIALFRSDDIPVSVGILIDNSGSMRALRSKMEAAALAFARASNPQDEMFVLNFADKPRIDVPFTSDIHALEAGIGRIDAIGGTALRDAVDAAEIYLSQHARRDCRVLLVMTDGNDNASVISTARIRTRAQQGGIIIYAVSLFAADPSKEKRARRELDDLAEPTGGAAHYLESADQIEPTALDVARQIRRQYTIAYMPLNEALDGTYRRVRVAVKEPRGLSVRTRTGYYATATRRSHGAGRDAMHQREQEWTE